MDDTRTKEELIEEINELRAALGHIRMECDEHPEDVARYEELRHLFEGSPDGYARVDMEGVYQDFNPAYVDMLGYSRDELFTKTYSDLTPEKWHAIERDIHEQEVLERGYSNPFEKEYIRKDGSLLPVEVRVYLTRNGKGDPNGMWAIVTNISGRKSSREALRESEQRFRDITLSIGDWAWELDHAGRIIFVSDKVEKILQLPSASLLGRRPSDFMKKDEGRRVRKIFEQAYALKANLENVEFYHITGDGSERLFQTNGVPVIGKDGSVVGYRGVGKDITAQREMEKAILRSEQRFKDITLSMGDWIWEVDTEGVYTFLAGKVDEVLGYPTEDVLGKTPFDFMPEDEAQRIRAVFTELIKDRRPIQDLENKNITKDGRQVLRLTNGFPFYDENGDFLGYRGVDKDITEKKSLEHALEHSEEKFRQISDNANDAIILIDNNDLITFWNNAAETIFGYSKKEMFGKKLHDLIMPDKYSERFEKGFGHFVKTGAGPLLGQTTEVLGKRKDGSTVDVELSISSTMVDNEWHAIGIVRDISSRKESESELNLLNTGISQSYDAVVITSCKGEILYVNPSFERLSGYTHDEAIGNSPDLLKSGMHPQTFYRDMWETILSGEIWKGEVINKKKNGELYYEEMTITPVHTEEKITHFVAIKRDISDKKKLERNIADLRREYEAFMRHEIKNLLTPMKGYSDLLIMTIGEELDEKSVMFLNKISESADNASRLIDSLKKLQDIENGTYKLEKTRYSLEELVQGRVLEFQMTAVNTGVIIQFESASKNTTFPMDLSLLPGIFNNLIKNAVEHVSALDELSQKTVTVTMRDDDDSVTVFINNKGKAVSPEKLLTFFDKFNSDPKKVDGTGLGTTYAYLVTNAHRGHITVESNERAGTTVSVKFPLE